MKKLFTSVAFCAFVLFQSCTKEELTPQEPIATMPVNIANVVAAMKENFVLSGAKAILTTPADNDPSTNLTTLYMADAQGRIAPIIDNFEVKDVRVTTNGIYVLTNYGTTAFFVKFDNSWLELKEVGTYKGENDNGDLVFSNLAILNTKTLTVDRSQVLPATSYVHVNSGNLSLIVNANGNRLVNHVTRKGYDLPDCISKNENMASYNNNKMAIIGDCSAGEGTKRYFDMETGAYTTSNQLQLNHENLRLANGDLVALQLPYAYKYGGIEYTLTYLTAAGQVTAKSDIGLYLDDASVPSSRFKIGEPNKVLYSSDKYYLVKETDRVTLLDKTTLNKKGEVLVGFFEKMITVDGSLLYYSGSDDYGHTVSGVINLDTKQDVVLDTTNQFSNIQPL